MYIGVLIAPTEYSIHIDELARETEARGLESLWVPEHTHIPVSRRTPAHRRFPGADDELPKTYSHMFDPFIALMCAAALAATTLAVFTPTAARATRWTCG